MEEPVKKDFFWTVKYKRMVGSLLVDYLKRAFEELYPLVWRDHVNANGVDMKVYNHNSKPVYAIEVWNWRYGNYPSFKRLMGVVNNLRTSKAENKLLIISCLKPKYMKDVLKWCNKYNIHVIELGYQVNFLEWMFFEDEKKEYKMKPDEESTYKETSKILHKALRKIHNNPTLNLPICNNINKRNYKILGESLTMRLLEGINIEVTCMYDGYPSEDLLKQIDFIMWDIENLSCLWGVY